MNNEGKDAVLSRERIEEIRNEWDTDCYPATPEFRALCDMALRYRDVLDAEVERLRVDLKLSKQGWENCANMMRAEIVAKEQAERKLAEAVAALRRISKQHDCGCVPCRGQCTSKESLEIIVDGIRELAQNAIDEATK